MKKGLIGVIVVGLIFGLMVIGQPEKVSAEESWVLLGATSDTTFTHVNLDEAAKTAPDWLQLFTDGIKITQPAKICSAFRRGEFKWVPKFYQFKNNQWISLKTTKEYLYGEEGGLYACAQPAEAGTYALFAYYNGPAENNNLAVNCEEFTKNWSVDLNNAGLGVFHFQAHFDNITQADVPVTYEISHFAYGDSDFPEEIHTGSGVTVIDGGGSKVIFSNTIPNTAWSLDVTISAQDCSVTRPITFTGP